MHSATYCLAPDPGLEDYTSTECTSTIDTESKETSVSLEVEVLEELTYKHHSLPAMYKQQFTVFTRG